MEPNDTLKTALDLIAKPDPAKSSEDLRQVRDDLDIAGAEAEIGQLQQRRRDLLLSGDDTVVEEIDAELRAFGRSLDRRRAASQAMDGLIAAALAREAEQTLEDLGAWALAARVRAVEAYLRLDKAALELVEALGTIHREEAALTEANAELRNAGRRDLVVEMPMDAVPRLSGVEHQFWVPVSHWTFQAPGYTHEPPGREGASAAPAVGKRRFSALAALLPDATPSLKAA